MPLLRRLRGAVGALSSRPEPVETTWSGLDAVPAPPRDARTVAGGEVETVRAAERLEIGTTRRPGEHLRVRRRIVTEEVTKTVEVRREELVVEAVEGPADARPGREGTARPAGPEAIELTLHREEVVVERRVVPYERVRLSRAEETDERELRADLRREEVLVERASAPAADPPPPDPA